MSLYSYDKPKSLNTTTTYIYYHLFFPEESGHALWCDTDSSWVLKF